MIQKAHIYTPADDSLESRVQALRSALASQREVERSLKIAKDNKLSRTLGSPEEVMQASKIIMNGLKKAFDSLSPNDLKEASNRGLINSEESNKISVAQRKQEMQSFRNEQTQDQSSENNLKK